MKVTLENAKTLSFGDYLHFDRPGNRNGCERWRVNGSVKTWKTDATRVRVPLKHGLRSYGAINESDFGPDGNAIGTMADARIVRADHPCEFCGLSY